jgi:hypothetical protein
MHCFSGVWQKAKRLQQLLAVIVVREVFCNCSINFLTKSLLIDDVFVSRKSGDTRDNRPFDLICDMRLELLFAHRAPNGLRYLNVHNDIAA